MEIILVLVVLAVLLTMGGKDAADMRDTAVNQAPQGRHETSEQYNDRIATGQKMQCLPALAFGGCLVPFALFVFAFFIAVWSGAI
jgi:hypothetical protein